MIGPRPTPLYTGDEMVIRWRERAERLLAYHDLTFTERGQAYALEACAAELEGALNAAREAMVEAVAGELRHVGRLGPAVRVEDRPLGVCDRCPGVLHARLADEDESGGCVEWKPVCAECADGLHEECSSEAAVTSPPGYSSADGLSTVVECCCGGAIR